MNREKRGVEARSSEDLFTWVGNDLRWVISAEDSREMKLGARETELISQRRGIKVGKYGDFS